MTFFIGWALGFISGGLVAIIGAAIYSTRIPEDEPYDEDTNFRAMIEKDAEMRAREADINAP